MTDELERTQERASLAPAEQGVTEQSEGEQSEDLSTAAGSADEPSSATEAERPTDREDPASLADERVGEGLAAEEAPDLPTESLPEPTKPLPETVEAPEPAHVHNGVAPAISSARTTLSAWASGALGRGRSLLSAHRPAVALVALACIGAVAGIVLLCMGASRLPADSLVKDDARARLAAPSYTPGDYVDGDPLVLQSVEVVRKRMSDTRRDGCIVDVVAVFANKGMETRADAQLSYVRTGEDSWGCTAASVGNAAHRAIAGVSHEQVIAHLETLLQEAEGADDGQETLATLYRSASCEVTGEGFDEEAQVDHLTLHCSRAEAFVSYECELSASFRFVPASGTWELTGAEVAPGAKELGFKPLMGTWRGTFRSQESTSAKCLGAHEAGLTVEVTSAAMTDEGARIEGTVSGVAHLHPDLDEDVEASEGDLDLHAVPFVGEMPSDGTEDDLLALLMGSSTEEEAGIVFRCAAQDVAGGSVTLTLVFGSASAPESATATLVSTHAYEDTFLLLVPYQRDARFSDTFSLERVG